MGQIRRKGNKEMESEKQGKMAELQKERGKGGGRERERRFEERVLRK